jgi:uncharacterized protein (AIM24 family)
MTKKTHTFGYEIVGDLLQAAVVTLAPGQSIVGSLGCMLFMEDSVRMDTGLTTHLEDPGLVGKVVEAATRRISGDGFFVTRFENGGTAKAQIGFAAPYPGKIIPFELDGHPDGIILQKTAFVAGSRDIDFAVSFQKRILVGIFGGEGFILQRISCAEKGALVLAHACGSIIERQLAEGDVLRIDTGCLVAYDPSVQFDVELMQGVRNMVFGGEGIFLATLRGPGRVWLQTMPLTRLAARLWDAAPQSEEVAAADPEAKPSVVSRLLKRAQGK